MESTMPIETILYLLFVVAAFTAFAVAVAYGEIQTRNFKRPEEAVAPVQSGEQEWRKAA
jgi:hypothetical protein